MFNILYYKVKFDNFSKVTFAHVFTKINYSSEFYGQNSIEINYIEKGGAFYETCGETLNIPENSIQLMINYHITLKESGESVGIYDQNYLSRLFKKVTSMSAKSFINNHISPISFTF